MLRSALKSIIIIRHCAHTSEGANVEIGVDAGTNDLRTMNSNIRIALALRLLMSYIYIYIYIYIYGAPILDVSRSHTTTQHSR